MKQLREQIETKTAKTLINSNLTNLNSKKMNELKGMQGIIKINEFLKSINIDAEKLDVNQWVKIKSEIEDVLLNNNDILKLIK